MMSSLIFYHLVGAASSFFENDFVVATISLLCSSSYQNKLYKTYEEREKIDVNGNKKNVKCIVIVS